MTDYVRNHDESRLPPRDAEGRVPHDQCREVSVRLMLAKGGDDVRTLMERVYAAEPEILHWSTNYIEPNER